MPKSKNINRTIIDNAIALQQENICLKDLIKEINDTIFAAGAPLGSERYFKIRSLCCKQLNQKGEE